MASRSFGFVVAAVLTVVVVACVQAQGLASIQQQAESGDAAAQVRLGSMYASGVGVDRDLTKAIEWLSKSADQGSTDGMSVLSLMYGAGRGVKQDFSTAYMWAAIADRLAPEAKRAEYAKSKSEMASWLSADQIAAADTRAAEWLRTHHLPT